MTLPWPPDPVKRLWDGEFHPPGEKENLASRDFKGLRAIAGLNGVRRRLAVFLGERPFQTGDGIEALPIREFLRELEHRTI